MADVTIYLRVTDAQLLNSEGGEVFHIEDLPGCHYTQKPTVRIYFLEADGVTPWSSLQATDGFVVAVKQVGQSYAVTPMARTTTGFTINAPGGWIEFTLNANTATWAAAVGTENDLDYDTQMEVKRTQGGVQKNIFRFYFVTKGLLDDEVTPTDEEPETIYATKAELAAYLLSAALYLPMHAITTTGLTAGKIYRGDGAMYAGDWTLADPDDDICETCELFLAISTTVLVSEVVFECVFGTAITGGILVGKPGYLSDSGTMTAVVPASPTYDGRIGRLVAWQRDDDHVYFNGHIPGKKFGA